MPAAKNLPRCLSRLAKPKQNQLAKLLLVGTAWLSTAVLPLSADESVLSFAEPADRSQQQSIDEARTFAPDEPATPATQKSANPFHRAANQWLTKTGSPPLVERAIEQNTQATIAPAPEHQAAKPAIATASQEFSNALHEFSSTFSPLVEPVAQVESADKNSADNSVNCYTSKPLTQLTTYIGLPQGNLPADAAIACAAVAQTNGDRRQDIGWAMTDFNWSATCMHHRPLYFEDENLERHGYTASCRFQPIISGAKFFFNIPLLPYKMTIDPPRSCVYTLGYYRPGSCAPRHWHRLPLRVGASVVEASVIVGLVFLIP